MVKKTFNRLSILFLMLLGTLPQIALLVQSMDCGADRHLWLWLLGAALCLWVSACFHRGLLLGMPASAALLYAASCCFDANPIPQLDDLIDRFSGAYYTSFLSNGSPYQYLHSVEDHSFLLLLIAFLLLAYLSSALTSSGGRRFMCLLGSLPLPAACLAVNGRPSYAPIVAMLLFWTLVLASGNYTDKGSSGKTVFGLTLPLLLLLTGILWANHPEDYDYTQSQNVLSEYFERIDEWIRQRLELSENEYGPVLPITVEATPEGFVEVDEPLLWESSAGGMDLTQHYDREMLEKLFFSVKPDESGILYLRAVSYGDYLGTAWSVAPEAPCSSLAFAADALQPVGRERSLTFRFAEKLRHAVVPYYSLLADVGDAGISGELQPNRASFFSWSGSMDPLTSSAEDEPDYRSFAHEIYTRLPESTGSVMLTLAAQAGLDSASPDIVNEIAAYIRSSGEYDIETPPYLSEDYAVCFLTQAHRGYCVHFATAAVAMYRALGIPARITEGFLVHAERGRFTEVKGAHAHAWAEVYQDGLGWVPVEVTGRGGLDQLPEETVEPLVSSAPDDFPAETAAPQIRYQEEAKNPVSLPVGVMQESATADSPQGELPLRKTLANFMLFVLALSALPLWRRLRHAVWRKRLAQDNLNRTAVALWKRSQQASRFGGSVPSEIRNCAEKAYFSARGATAEELLICRALFDKQIETLDSSLPFPKRFLFRYLYGFK